MKRRDVLGMAAVAAAAGFARIPVARADDPIRIGAVGPKAGRFAEGAAYTYWPNVRLWARQVNDAGGLKLKDGRRNVRLIEYDDRSDPEQTIAAVESLATNDRADFVLAPYDTGLSLAAASAYAKYGYPEITSTALTDRASDFAKIFPGLFFTLGTVSGLVDGVEEVLGRFAGREWIGKRVAMVNVIDSFGTELARIAKPRLKNAGFDIVYDHPYPDGIGDKDVAAMIAEAEAAKPDAFIAWSYPEDTFRIVEQARAQKLSARMVYAAFGTASPAFGKKFGKAADAIFGAGGSNPDSPAMKAYLAAYRKMNGGAPDAWAGPVVYATCQILGQAIEGVGAPDRKAVAAYLRDRPFETVIGPVSYADQQNAAFWTIGQWQDGRYFGIGSKGRPGARTPLLKTGW